MQKVYKVEEGGLHWRFDQSRAKIQVFGGGFANGKTAAACVLKVLRVAKDYPGANILVARSTYPKLNDTIRKEFFKWCPKHWIKSFNKADNIVEMVNGTTVNFRYIAQQGKNNETTTSNLLSATYDLIVVDQIEDPEITEKDFLDLLGRLRGMAQYVGNDPSMPRSGPRWLVVTCNPTRNWFFRSVVRPLHRYMETGRRDADLLVDPKTGEPIIDLFEGSTYENKDNLEQDFIDTLEATYKGQMRDRFLLGRWSAYEGLVYPMFDEPTHVLPHQSIVEYYEHLLTAGVMPNVIEGYDHGIAVPSCYLWGFVDTRGNVFITDGHYKKETTIEEHAGLINGVRSEYLSDRSLRILADPSLFRRSTGDSRTVGRTVAEMFEEYGVHMEPGNNDIINGIHKVQQYLTFQDKHPHPIFEDELGMAVLGAPYLFVSDKLDFVVNEFNDYYWKKDTAGQQMDVPNDKNDHAMDCVKYLLSRRPKLAVFVKKQADTNPGWMKWHEMEQANNRRSARYG